MTRSELAAMIDHTQLRPYATQLDVSELCEEAAYFGVAAVTVNPAWVSYCVNRLGGTGVGVNATVGFPLGANTARIKVEEAREAVKNGASELDMVINVGALKSGFPQFVEREIAAVVKVAGDAPVKVILEASYLTDEEKVAVCEMSRVGGAAFVMTSTGYGTEGAVQEDIALMRKTVGDDLGIKAAGGIRNYRDTMIFIAAGATRVGTSATIRIIDEVPEEDFEAET